MKVMKPKKNKTKPVKAWAIVRIGKRFNSYYKGFKVHYYGALNIPNLAIYPKNKAGKKHAQGDFNGHEEMVEVEIKLIRRKKK